MNRSLHDLTNHASFPVFPPLSQRLPRPTTENTVQFALFTSPIWLPVGSIGFRLLQSLLRRLIGGRHWNQIRVEFVYEPD
jgi:hypothetical protein